MLLDPPEFEMLSTALMMYEKYKTARTKNDENYRKTKNKSFRDDNSSCKNKNLDLEIHE